MLPIIIAVGCTDNAPTSCSLSFLLHHRIACSNGGRLLSYLPVDVILQPYIEVTDYIIKFIHFCNQVLTKAG